MDIKVSGRKTTVTDALRAHVDEKIGEALKVFDINPMTVDVVLRYEKNPSNPNPAIVEVTVRVRGSVIRVAEHGADMYSAIDLSADKVTRQLRKFKTRVVDNRQQGPSAAEVAPVPSVEDLGRPADPRGGGRAAGSREGHRHHADDRGTGARADRSSGA